MAYVTRYVANLYNLIPTFGKYVNAGMSQNKRLII